MRLRWYTFEKRRLDVRHAARGRFHSLERPVVPPGRHAPSGRTARLYIADWYDINLSHSNPKNRSQWYAPSRDDGRIFRVSAERGRSSFDQADGHVWGQLDIADVAALLNHPNEWYRREAWRILGERRDRSIVPALEQKFAAASDEVAALETLWAIDLCGGFDEAFAARALAHPARIRPRLDRATVGGQAGSLANDRRRARAAGQIRSERVVRSQLACTAKRLPGTAALPIVAELLDRDEDAGDPHIPLLIWWAIESKAISDRDAVLALVSRTGNLEAAIVRDVIVERLARRVHGSRATIDGYAACAWLLEHAPSAADVERIVAGMETQLAGHRFRPAAGSARTAPGQLLNGRRAVDCALCLAIRWALQEAVPKSDDACQRFGHA